MDAHSGGICFLILAGFGLLFDGGSPLRALAFPLVVIGANSIFIYCLYETATPWLEQQIKTNGALLQRIDWWRERTAQYAAYESIARGAIVILVYWLVLLWMYRKRVFVKI